MTFKELNLSAPLLRAVQEAGYETPSPIQAAAIPPVLSGRDLMGCAQTGVKCKRPQDQRTKGYWCDVYPQRR